MSDYIHVYNIILIICILIFLLEGAMNTYVPEGFMGCYESSDTQGILNISLPDSDTNSGDECKQRCSSNGYRYAGTEYFTECSCGDALGDYQKVPECDLPCMGNMNETCGGISSISVYDTWGSMNTYVPEGFVGCYENSDTQRILNISLPDSDTNSGDECKQRCSSNGYRYAGTEFFTECSCGNELGDYLKVSGCDLPCMGNMNETCGGISSILVYDTWDLTTSTPTRSVSTTDLTTDLTTSIPRSASTTDLTTSTRTRSVSPSDITVITISEQDDTLNTVYVVAPVVVFILLLFVLAITYSIHECWTRMYGAIHPDSYGHIHDFQINVASPGTSRGSILLGKCSDFEGGIMITRSNYQTAGAERSEYDQISCARDTEVSTQEVLEGNILSASGDQQDTANMREIVRSTTPGSTVINLTSDEADYYEKLQSHRNSSLENVYKELENSDTLERSGTSGSENTSVTDIYTSID